MAKFTQDKLPTKETESALGFRNPARRTARCMSLLVCVTVLLTGPGHADDSERSSSRRSPGRTDANRTEHAAGVSKVAAAKNFESFHAFLLIAERPLHLKLNVRVDGQSPGAAIEKCARDLSKKLDANGDGKLSREEFSRSPLVRKIVRTKARNFLKSLGPQPPVRADEVRKHVLSAAGGSPLAIRANSSTAENDSGIFDLLDRDSSGLLDEDEIAAAEQTLMARDTDHDDVLAFDEFRNNVEQNVIGLALPEGMEERTGAKQSDLMILTTAFTRLRSEFFRKYDADRNRRLSAEELHWDDETLNQFDRNGDGLISSMELIRLNSAPVDLELAVDLNSPPAEKAAPVEASQNAEDEEDSAKAAKVKDAAGSAAQQNGSAAQADAEDGNTPPPVVEVVGVRDSAADVSVKSGVVSVKCDGVRIQLAVRSIDPMKSSLDNAMQGFNLLDTDGNGYLDKPEVGERVRMARGLFEMIDTDGDEKIFAKEIGDYISFVGTPAASTVRINVFDTGYGFFQHLDANTDGRLSVRELRTVADSLSKMERDNEPGLSPTEPVRNYYVEFVRGSFRMFGQRSQVVAPTDASFVRAATAGPIWFQKMDRNNDGDLTWEEFLGPRDVFEKLDADDDTLIDADEATKAGGGS